MVIKEESRPKKIKKSIPESRVFFSHQQSLENSLERIEENKPEKTPDKPINFDLRAKRNSELLTLKKFYDTYGKFSPEIPGGSSAQQFYRMIEY